MSKHMVDEKNYEKLYEELDETFPKTPFSISCVDYLHELDEVFTEQNTIIIVDDRAKSWHVWNETFNDVQNIHEYINYTVVKKVNEQPITMRQVIQAMIDDKHYWNEVVQRDCHVFLEGFDKRDRSEIEYVAYFGS